jgi:hypothetical protein
MIVYFDNGIAGFHFAEPANADPRPLHKLTLGKALTPTLVFDPATRDQLQSVENAVVWSLANRRS